MIANKPAVFELNWFDLEETDKVATPILDILTEGRRLPELIIFINASEKAVMSRKLDVDGITNDFEE
jgi:hypothetical protein